MKRAHQGSLAVDNDPHAETARQLLKQALAGSEKGYIANLGVSDFRIHFHLPSNRSLLRLWKKNQNKSGRPQFFFEEPSKPWPRRRMSP